jgi:hypothetical protein
VPKFTAPNRASDLRVGARNWTGSMSSGGTHILIREPCCWKWHSSRLHRSMPRFLASLRRFFKRYLFFWVGLSNQWTRFPKPKTQVSKNSLALPYPQVHAVGLPEMMGKELPIPEILFISQIAGLPAKVPTYHIPLLCCQPSWPTGPPTIAQTSKAVPFKTANPALNSGRVLPKETPNLRATQTATDQQHSMKSMVIPSLLGSRNLLLNSNAHNGSIGYLKFSHPAALLNATVTGGRAFDKNFIPQYL